MLFSGHTLSIMNHQRSSGTVVRSGIQRRKARWKRHSRTSAESGLLLHRHTFGQVSGLVYVAASADGDVVGEELEGDDFEDGEE